MAKIPKKKREKSPDIKNRAVEILKKRQYTNVVFSIFVILLLGTVAFLVYMNTVQSGTPNWVDDLRSRIFPQQEEVAAVVNGEEITMSELNAELELVPPEYPPEEILNRMIDETLLLQEAEERGITVTDEEVDAQIDLLLAQSGITREEFIQSIESRDMTMDDVREFYGRRIILTKLINETVKVNITRADVEEFYFDNLEEFTIPETVNVSHILICHNESIRCVSNLTVEEALDKALEVKEMLNGSNFNQVARNQSYEPAAQITNGNLGLVSRDAPFDQTFLNHTFALDEGEVSEPVLTEFGYHLIKVHERREEQVLEIDAVEPQIKQYLENERQQQEFMAFLEELREEADIVIFYNQ